jgi:uncharacterized spore protein YtfJ
MGTLRAREIYHDAGFMLIAVESVDFQHSKTNIGWQLYGNIEPIAVIVCGPDGTYALDMEAKPAAFDQLKQEIPEIDSIIASFNKAKQ